MAIDGFIGMRKDDATRDGSNNVEIWRLKLVAEYLLRDGCKPQNPIELTLYIPEYSIIQWGFG